jgi:cyclohexadieny/prephenate dehydrogenase
MAGSEKTGWEHAQADLFEGRTCFVTPVAASAIPKLSARVVAFWRDLGAEVVTVDPDKHDEIVAHISHLPQVLASSLCAFLSTGPGLAQLRRRRASATRPGSPPPTPSSGGRSSRRTATRCSGRSGDFQDDLQGIQAALANRDFVEVTARLERGRAYRDKFRPAP